MAKKKKGCLGCVLSIFIIPIIVLSVAFGVGWVMFDKHAKPLIGINLGQSIGLVTGLYGGSEKKIVTNPYDKKEDLAGFMTEFKKGVFASQDSDISIADIMEGLLPKTDDAQLQSSTETGVFANGTNLTGNTSLDKLLANINFDFSSLATYDGSPKTINITDKQIAAVLQEVFTSASGHISALKSIEETLGASLNDLISVMQVIVQKDDDGAVYNAITLKVDIKALVKAVLEKNSLKQFEFATFLLPSRLFVTAKVYPKSDDKAAKITIDNYSAKQKANFNTMLDTVLPKAQGSISSAEEFFKSINKAVVDVFAKIETYVPLDYVESSMQIKPIVALLKALNIGDNVSEQQFLTMIKTIKFVDANAIITNPYDAIEDKRALQDLLAAEYGLNRQELEKLDLSKDLALMPGLVEKDEIIKKLRADAEKKVEISDRMLAALYESTLLNISGLKDLNVRLAEITISKKVIGQDASGEDNFLTEIMSVIEIDLYKTFMTKASSMPGIVKNLVRALFDSGKSDPTGNLLPQKLYLSSGTVLGGEGLYRTVLRINELDEQGTVAMLETLGNIALSFLNDDSIKAVLDIEALRASVAEGIKNAIINIEGEKGLNQPLNYGDGSVLMPSIFDFIKTTGKLAMDAYSIYDVLLGVHKVNPIMGNSSVVGSDTTSVQFSNFVNELNTDYFLQDSKKISEIIGDFKYAITELTKNFNSSYLKIQPQNGEDQSSLLSTKRPLIDVAGEDLRVMMSEAALADFLSTNNINISSDGQIKGVKVIGAYIEDGDPQIEEEQLLGVRYLRIVAQVKLIQSESNKYNNLMPEIFYIVAHIDLDTKDETGAIEYKTTVSLNEMSLEQVGNFFTLVNAFKGASGTAFDKSTFEADIQKSVKQALGDITASGKMGLIFEDNGEAGGRIVLPTVFNIVHAELFKGSATAPTDEEFRAALQGLHKVKDFEKIAGDDTSGSKLFNTDYSAAPEPSLTGVKVSLTDTYLAKLVNNRLSNEEVVSGSGIKDMSIVQTIISGGVSKSIKMVEVESVFGSDFTYLFSENQYIMMTIRVPLTQFMPKDANAIVKDFLPSYVYATMIIDKTTGEAQTFINSLNQTELAALEATINAISAQNTAGVLLDFSAIIDTINTEINTLTVVSQDIINKSGISEDNFYIVNFFRNSKCVIQPSDVHGIGKLEYSFF